MSKLNVLSFGVLAMASGAFGGVVAGPASGPLIVGTGSGPSQALRYLPPGAPTSYLPYAGGVLPVRVAGGDLDNDGVADIITGAGPGAGPHVKAFNGGNGVEVRSFFAYDAGFAGGVNVASGDVNGDGYADIVTGAGSGATGGHVKVFDGRNGLQFKSFFAYGGFDGGVRVASGDVNGDGYGDIITGAGSTNSHIKVFDGANGSELRSFFAYGAAALAGGVSVASGDVNGDGFADIITGAGAGGGPHIKVFDGVNGAELRSFFAFDAGFTGGINIGAGDVDGDGRDDVIVGTATGAPHVKVFDGVTGLLDLELFPFGTSVDGVYVAGVSVIPVPGTAALMVVAAGVLGGRRRRVGNR